MVIEIVKTVGYVFIGLCILDVIVLAAWIAFVEIRDRKKIKNGELLIVDYSAAIDEDLAIERAKAIL